MKKFLTLIIGAFILIGCGSKTVDASTIAKALNNKDLKVLISDQEETIESGLLDKESALSSYNKVLEKYSTTDDSKMNKEASAFISLYSQFAEELINKLEAEEATAEYIGVKKDNFVEGIMIYVLVENFVLTQDAIDELNQNPSNEIEKVIVKDNIVITVDKGFVSDFNVFKEFAEEVLNKYITE